MKFRNARLILLALCMSLVYSAFGQSFDHVRVGSCTLQSARIKLDSLSIRPGTFHINGVDTTQYRLDYITATLYLVDSSLLDKTVSYQYQVFDLDFTKPVSHRSTSLIEPSPRNFQPLVTPLSTFSDFQSDELITSGFVSRGVTIGNNQDLALNSALNLQLSGKLSEDVEIQATISDKNVPIQPEGNTEYLSNINNIFITLYIKKKLRIDAGDIATVSPVDPFLKANRNLLGMNLNLKLSEPKFKSQHSVGGGVAKGLYVRQNIAVQNGMQGPYRLYGANNEPNIVVVAGSERVYVDGVLMTRGQENDYVIDYNTAEITFTPAMLITAEKRVMVEFECTDRHYSRYNLFTFNEMEVGQKRPVKIKVNFFQEQDLKNQSIQPELTDRHKLFLAELGDAESFAYFQNADSTTYSADRVLYCKKDTVVDGMGYTIYVYSTNDSVQLYSVGFTYMGTNKGSYKLLSSTANGRVFGWVAPVDGVPQGDYDPVQLLATPKLLQMATVSAEYHFKPKSFIQTELALSNYDRNTFSRQDDRDNVGFAYFLNLGHAQNLKSKNADTALWQLSTALQWQFLHRNFHAVESFREVEFARNYNLDQDYSDTRSEQMLQAMVSLSNPQVGTNRYTFNWFSRIGALNAWRNELWLQNGWRRWVSHTRTSWLYSTDSLQTSSFVSSDNKIAYRFEKVEMGVTDLLEHNIFRTAVSHSMRLNSYAFNEAVAYLKNSDTSIYKYNISYKNRVEFTPQMEQLRQHLLVHEANASFSFEKIKNQSFTVRGTYRNQQLQDSIGKSHAEHYFVGNVGYSGRFCKNAIILSTYYEMGSGMEMKKNYTYIKVAAGQGTYVWRDYNGNGIEEIDEFEVAAFQDEAEYVKVWLTGTDYVNTYNMQLAQTIQLRPASVWRNSQGIKRFLARFANITMLRSQVKQSVMAFNPFPLHLEDTNLVSRNLTLNNTFSFNNSASKFAFDFIVQEVRNKNLLYYGSEYNSSSLQQIVLKSTPHKSVYMQVNYAHQNLRNTSEMLLSRCYEILQHSCGADVQLQFKNAYFTSLNYSFSAKRNTQGVERAQMHDVKGIFSYKMLKRGVLSANLQYVQVRGEVPENNAVAYTMLNGLSVGGNVLWGADCQISVTDFLQVSLQYVGRKSEHHKPVHTGSLSLKAHF